MEPIVRITEDVEIYFMNGGFEERTVVQGAPKLSEYDPKTLPADQMEYINPNISKHICIELDGDLYEWIEI